MRAIWTDKPWSALAVVLLLCAVGGARAQDDQPRQVPPPPSGAVSVPDGELPGYDELPLAIRREYPRPDLEVHYYASDPEQRYALINGFHGREGLPIGRELWIHEIRPDGVVLRVQDRFFLIRR